MEKDLMYYFDKKSPYQRHELGEIQTGFNMSLTIDGTKDSMQVQVYNFDEKEITPNTILYHKGTGTWWVVVRDIVKRYANEKNYWYTHNLTINGAIDLLNARDLTDCGFNDKTYTIDQFIKRLFSLSTFEFPLTINYGNNVDENKIVDYIKSFENYTPLSALREFLNGYNCDAKLTFNTTTNSGETYISGATLNIVPRTGNVDLDEINISEFDDIRETKTINKESYGTTVVSNAQNVNSTLAKTYPQVGSINQTADDYDITSNNAYLLLPSPVYKVNWIKMFFRAKATFYVRKEWADQPETRALYYDFSTTNDDIYLDGRMREIANAVANVFGGSSSEHTTIVNNLLNPANKKKIYNILKPASTITLRAGWRFDPISKSFIAPENDNEFYFPHVQKEKRMPYEQVLTNASLLIGSKEERDGITYKSRCIYYERGSNKISGFDWMSNAGASYGGNQYVSELTSYSYTDLRNNNTYTGNFYVGTSDGRPVYVNVVLATPIYGGTDSEDDTHKRLYFNISTVSFQVNYIPMSDIKIKYDNSRNDNDTHIYNQNGKLNDSVALSKLVDSYAKEIQSDNITRYMHYTDFSDIQQVGTIVDNNGEKYVINNISYDFFVNEESEENEIPYYIECEFTMSKYMSVKSLMVNPNSNIRDYGIPQKFNIKRRQVYRDYYEFSLSQDAHANQETPYVELDNYIVIGTNVAQHEYDHTAIIKIDYDEPLSEHTSWYYQLNSTAYIMNKSIYEVVDFGDNNIIGYDMQNASSGFDMSNLFNSTYRAVNTPITYTDYNGKLKGITIQFVNSENTETIYNNVRENNDYVNLASHVFVGENFYYGKYETLTTYSSESDNWFTNMQGTGELTYTFAKPTGYIDNTASVSNIVMLDRADNVMSGATCNVDSITETDDTIVITFSYDTGTNLDYGSLQFRVNYSYTHQVYAGAIDIKDYEIKELEYGKDAIEVPVFEYILQLGDTEQVEVGERILDTGSGMLQMYTCDVRNPNTTTQLNASKVFSGLDITGDTLDGDDNYDRQVEIADTSAVDISFENNNTIMRIKVYSNQVALFYGNSDQEFTYQSTQVSSTQLPKSYLKGKDIVIYKNVINSMTYDTSEDEATCDYNNELMFIIHNPQDSNFDGDDLLINVNYYKLR